MPVAASLLGRIERDTAIVCGGLALAALIVWPSRPLIAGGVVGGGLLVGIAYAAIRDAVLQERPRRHLVKFFTRHVILAVAAYLMVARLRLDAVGMLAGASSLLMAVALEAARDGRSRPEASGRERKRD